MHKGNEGEKEKLFPSRRYFKPTVKGCETFPEAKQTAFYSFLLSLLLLLLLFFQHETFFMTILHDATFVKRGFAHIYRVSCIDQWLWYVQLFAVVNVSPCLLLQVVKKKVTCQSNNRIISVQVLCLPIECKQPL